MQDGNSEGGPLVRWLSGDGLVALDALAREALDIVAVIDGDLKVRYINWTGPGVTRESVIGRNATDLSPPDDREVAQGVYARVLQTGVGTSFEAMYRHDDDVRIWDTRVGPIRFEGVIIGLIVITTNVTEKRREQADRDRFFSLSLDMLIVASASGRLKRANPAFGEALGYDMVELMGRPFIDFVHPEDRARTVEAFAGVVGGTPVTDFENRYRRMDGQYRTFSWRATVDPVTAHVYAVARDVTDHRSTETQLRRAQKLDAIGQLAGGVAHDFNNLMQAVLANTELALAVTPPSSRIAERLGEIEAAGHRAAQLTKQLLAFSRRQPLHAVPVELNKLTGGLMKMLRRLLPENIDIDFVPGHNLASVSADPGQLEQVILNLCVNARDAMEHGGKLSIETENVLVNGSYRKTHPWARPGRYVLLSITDTGIGMTDDVRERAFEPFFTTKSGGTGLGLSTTYGIVRQHEGMIHVYSEVGEGTTFKVYFPADARLAAEVGDKIAALPPRGQETILLAEDEQAVREVVVEILEGAGYRALAASDGPEAIRLLREQKDPVHLALLDVVMPVLGGPETWEQLRAIRPGLRVIFASGYADDRYLQRLPAGADVVEKPFRMEELLRRIRDKLDE